MMSTSGPPGDAEDQLQPSDTLEDRGVADVLDEGYSPPEHEPAHLRTGMTSEEQRAGTSLDARLAAEDPEPDPFVQAAHHDFEARDRRAGRLVSPDAGARRDTEKDAVAQDVGIDGAGASAEEAAVHVVGDGIGPETD